MPLKLPLTLSDFMENKNDFGFEQPSRVDWDAIGVCAPTLCVAHGVFFPLCLRLRRRWQISGRAERGHLLVICLLPERRSY
jgi:hypothetical protein